MTKQIKIFGIVDNKYVLIHKFPESQAMKDFKLIVKDGEICAEEREVKYGR